MSRIIKLESENILCLKAISIVPEGSLVKITGPNDAGKTAILRSIWMAIGGKKEIPADAIREGQDKGFVQLDIGDNGEIECTARLNLRRRENGTIKAEEIILKDAKGRVQGSPMSRISDMLGFGRGQFDPLVFRDAKPDKQVEMLQTALGLDFSELEAERDTQYKTRTNINTEAKTLAAQIPADDPDAPDTETSVAELSQQHEAALEAQASNERHKAAIAVAEQEVLDANAQSKRILEQREELTREVAALDDTLGEQAMVIARKNQALGTLHEQPLAQVADVDAIKTAIDNAESNNQRARTKAQRMKLIKDVDDLKGKSDAITNALATIKATKDKMIADADFPINGVEIVDGAILVSGHPLANQGGAAQLRFGALLVMKSDPKLRIITMDEALGKLDDESIEMLDVLLEEHNFQALITGPRAVGEGCIEIRNGEVVTG